MCTGNIPYISITLHIHKTYGEKVSFLYFAKISQIGKKQFS